MLGGQHEDALVVPAQKDELHPEGLAMTADALCPRCHAVSRVYIEVYKEYTSFECPHCKAQNIQPRLRSASVMRRAG